MKKIKNYIHDYPQVVISGVALLSFVFIFIGLSVSYINKFNETLLAENESHLSEIANHISIYTQSVINDTKNSLQNAAYSLAAIPEEQRLTYMNDIAARQEFAYVGYAKKNGDFQATEITQNKNIEEEVSFQNALLGETTISDLERRVFKDRVVSGIIITVPIYNESHETIGAMAAMVDSTQLDDALEVESFQGAGYSYIIDKEGDLILHNKSMDYSNFYRILENSELERGNTLEKIKQSISSGESGLINYTQLGVERYAYYTNVGINSWTILNIVDSHIVTAKTDMLMKELIIIASCFIIGFLILLVFAGISWIVSENQKHMSHSKSIFLANMSHEIRTPMNVIMGTGEILLRSDLKVNQRKYVENIINSSQNLLSIINDVLDFSKIESGKFTITNDVYDLDSILYEISSLAAVRLDENNVNFIVDIDKDVPNHLFGDKVRVKQILVNIVGNAIKFTEKGFIKLSVSSYYKDYQFYLKIKVKDTGIGIKKENLTKLFESFNQVDTHYNHNIEGTGLGLAICKSLCQLMNGSIQVESEYGVGSTFTVIIQQHAPDNKPLLNMQTDKSIKLCMYEPTIYLREFYKKYLDMANIDYTIHHHSDEFLIDMINEEYDYICISESLFDRLPKDVDLNKIIVLLYEQVPTFVSNEYHTIFIPMFGLELSKILQKSEDTHLVRNDVHNKIKPLSHSCVLIVDDNQINREITEEIIKLYDIQTETAASGREAIELIKTRKFDLVFMDHMMPCMDGVETLKEIRSLPGEEYQTLPIVVLTANAIQDAKTMLLKSGFDDFMSKPIEMDKLNDILEKWLRAVNDSRL